MPRQLLRDGVVVIDDWVYLADRDVDATPAAAGGTILSLDQWLADKARWLATPSRLGVVLLPDHKVERLAHDLARFDLVAAEFPGPSDGRGYSQGRLLRERHGFRGELRATGYVRRDQLFFLARCGFNSFELQDADIADAVSALRTFSGRYQPASDGSLPGELHHR